MWNSNFQILSRAPEIRQRSWINMPGEKLCGIKATPNRAQKRQITKRGNEDNKKWKLEVA